MQFDPQIVAQANAFVNALRSGKRARVPALKLEHWLMRRAINAAHPRDK
ncbi:succinate dehydrogenase flavoprotein subunit [Salmonella enterica]|nr:succinate dehydrogenase flavoprotein subunit [Salmonella enterica]